MLRGADELALLVLLPPPLPPPLLLITLAVDERFEEIFECLALLEDVELLLLVLVFAVDVVVSMLEWLAACVALFALLLLLY